VERRDRRAYARADHRFRDWIDLAIDAAKDGKTIYFLYGNEETTPCS
jgi:hypothetical protein